MKYFAKNLEVPGKIYQGDRYFDDDGVYVRTEKDDSLYKGLKKCELFLCKWTNKEKGEFERMYRVSLDAFWIKQGDEIDENDIQLFWWNSFVRGEATTPYNELTKNINISSFTGLVNESMVVIAKVYNHSCKHFH